MGKTVFVTAPALADDGLKALNDAGLRTIFLPKGGEQHDVERILATEDIDAVISRTVPLSAAAIQTATNLKVITKHGVGVSNIDVTAATRRGIPVYVTPGANAQSVAELTIALLLAAARKVAWMDSQLRSGNWNRMQNGIELHGRTLGLVGAGRVGQIVAEVASSLGMTVLAFDPALGDSAPTSRISMVATLGELLDRSNVLSLHVPLTPQTRGLIGADEFERMPADSIIVNTARGEVIDEPAMIHALNQGRIVAAGLDTTWNEPMSAGNPLFELPNVVLTPHVGGSTTAALSKMALAAAHNIIDFFDRNRPASPAVNARELPTDRTKS